jgi:hypothetical protein
MFLVNTPSTKGECHLSLFFGLFENEKMNERHITMIRNTVENKGGNKQECVNLEAFILHSTYYPSLKNMEVVFFL